MICRKCHQDKPATTEFFPVCKKMVSGLQNECKVCAHARRRSYGYRTQGKWKAWKIGEVYACKTCGKEAVYSAENFRYHQCHDCYTQTVGKKALKRKYGVDHQFDPYWKSKGCEACGSKHRLVYDHCHDTGKLRGVLCQSCNTALGMLEDSEGRIMGLRKYLIARDHRKV